MMTKALSKANMSLARCWEGHVNSQLLLTGLANEEQQARWFKGIVERGETWAAWSGEPQSCVPGQPARFGTIVRELPDGYRIDGSKVFATSAVGARWAILLVNKHGPGGGRHADPSAADALLLLACDLRDPTIHFDETWWDPLGMRGTVSYLARFNGTFVPADNLIGRPGQYLREGWQTCFSPHYGATFLGGAEAASEYALAHVRTQNRMQDPYVQHHIAAMALNVESSLLWLRHVAELWEADQQQARSAGIRARFLLERWAIDTLEHAVCACGARGLIRPSPLERIYRDLTFYVRHDNSDQILATIGREVLGQPHDSSFFALPAAAVRPEDIQPTE
jgi:alkylation response protein AidB-like acyl-CoA dehydrogenase